MKNRTRGIVIALTSASAGGLLPTAVSTSMEGTLLLAFGLGLVAAMNVAVAWIHIDTTEDSAQKAETAPMQLTAAMSSGDVEMKLTHQRAASTGKAKEPLNFPVMGWYGSTAVDDEELPPAETSAKRPAKEKERA